MMTVRSLIKTVNWLTAERDALAKARCAITPEKGGKWDDKDYSTPQELADSITELLDVIMELDVL